ncbi:amino acid adenylation domain-containing protein [Hymenobacter sp. HMF4947]|uniref:Amino acid adenylation domain-containing protein n=2 Tax=Hymenobacter ginkgonis TaxID=2682976 RepID=A0A7K1T9R8_9BACT|nr:amino acid adenylation domain-containing protein [Hymenobacter ginkgonis]
MSERPAAPSAVAVGFDPFAGPEIVRLAPITEPQSEIWLACRLGGDDASRAYNESVALHLRGPLDPDALQQAVQTLVQRHEALRSVFSADGKYSCVLRELVLPTDYQDISSEAAARQQQLVDLYTRQDAHHLFDLLHGPLLKAGLLRLASNEHYFVLTVHHIICDGWSLAILLQDLGQLYSAYCQGQYPSLPAATSFSRYADQQLVFNRSPAYQRVEQFWLKEYQGEVPVVSLPTDFPRPAVRTYQSARADYPLAPELVAGLKKVGLGAGCSLVTTLLAAFEVLLHRFTGQADLVVGLPAAGQSAAGQLHLVGHCVNLLPLRSQPGAAANFGEYLRQRRPAILDAYENQQLTFGSLLKKLRLARDTARVPLVPVMFNIDLGLADHVDFQGLTYTLRSNPRAYEAFELFLNASGSEQALVLEWSFNTALFKPETIAQLMGSFEELLREIIANPATSLRGSVGGRAAAAPLADPYVSLNRTAQPYPATQTLTQLLTEQALATPQSVALRFEGSELTYFELHRQANQLANYLRDQGVQPGDVVALAVAREPALLLTLLATLKCGATYVPLDPAYPAERLAFMLTNSGAEFLLASDRTAPSAPATVLFVDDALAAARQYSGQAPAVQVASDSTLYVLYTSGSTGRPKGVQISHRNVVNFLHSMQQAPGITAADKLLAITTISFDIAGLELFLPLVSGATLVLANAATARDGRELLRVLAAEHITIMQATPSSWRLLLEAGWEQPLPLKVLCGGEALARDLADRLLPRSQSVWNMYGPTETTIWSTVKQLTYLDKLITIGRPIANTQVYILDEADRPVPVGGVGELCIAGDGVAQGYLHCDALTAEKFIANPFSTQPGARLYRTGDLGKLLETGELQCLGRLDQQVKVRGYRIEPGEIEHALTTLADVKEAVVITHEPHPGDERLVAYVVLSPAAAYGSASVGHWKKALLAQLPAYMVPSDFVVVPALPLTLNGKVDRQALRQHASPPPAPPAQPTSPRTDAEQLVASIWQEHLGGGVISVSDNFFELGGHSLIAVRVMLRLEQETGKRLPLAILFEHPTVEKLAAVLQLDSNAISWDSLVPIKPQGTKTPLYIVHGAGLNVLLFNAISKNMDAEQPVYGLQAKGLDGREEPLDSIEAMAAHYVAAIRATNPAGPYALAGYSFGGIIAFEMAKQLTAAGKVVKFLGMLDTYAYQSDADSPHLVRLFKRTKFLLNKLLYNFTLLKNNPRRTLLSNANTIKKLTVDQLKYTKKQHYELLHGHRFEIGQAQELAFNKYRLAPQPFTVHLFRNEDRVFYVEDFEHLGWKPFALGGIHIHDIPGNHNFIFAPPHDKECARILQEALNMHS